MRKFHKFSLYFSHLALSVIYIWFGALKVLSLSPASQMVIDLLHKTLPSVNSHQFLIFFGIFEVVIGVLFLIPKFTKIALILLFIHLIAIMAPLVLLPNLTWQKFLVPTLEGQYVIKNILILAIALHLADKRSY